MTLKEVNSKRRRERLHQHLERTRTKSKGGQRESKTGPCQCPLGMAGSLSRPERNLIDARGARRHQETVLVSARRRTDAGAPGGLFPQNTQDSFVKSVR